VASSRIKPSIIQTEGDEVNVKVFYGGKFLLKLPRVCLKRLPFYRPLKIFGKTWTNLRVHYPRFTLS
jgi:hypothetical protein